MVHRLLRGLTFANVCSVLALTIALGTGTAYAANTVFSTDIVDGEVKTVDLANNGVTTAKITNNQVYSGDVRDDTLLNGGLTSLDLAANSVTSDEILNESISHNDLASGSVGQFEIGSGAIPLRTYRKSASALDATTVKEITVVCNIGFLDGVTGGGFVIAGPNGINVPSVVIQRNYAVNNNTWLVRAVATSGTPTWQLTGIANCIQ